MLPSHGQCYSYVSTARLHSESNINEVEGNDEIAWLLQNITAAIGLNGMKCSCCHFKINVILGD